MGTYQVTWLMRWLGQECRNTFYYVTDVGEPSDGEWQDICDEIRADFVSEGLNVLVDTFTWYGITRRRVDTAGLLSFLEVPTLGDADGTEAVDSTPTQVALLISNKGTTTKPNRARTYMCGFSEDKVSGSLWGGTARAFGEAMIDRQSNLNTGGTNPLNRVAAQWNAGHTFVTATNDLQGAVSVASVVPATQRRRRIGVGI